MKARVCGFGLTETLLGLVLGGVVLSGLSMLYLRSAQQTREQHAMAQLQQDASYAFALLQEDLHHAGNLGCHVPGRARPQVWVSGASGLWWGDSTRPLAGLDETPDQGRLGDPVFPQTGLGQYGATVVRGDTFWVLRADTQHSAQAVTAAYPGTQPSLAFSDPQRQGFKNGSLLLWTDCQTESVLWQKTGPNDPDRLGAIEHGSAGAVQPGNCHPEGLGPHCPAPPSVTPNQIGKILPWLAHAYHIRYSPRQYPGPGSQAIPALYRQTLGPSGNQLASTAEELVSGVCDLQVRYGVDENGDGQVDGYWPASAITGQAPWEWSRVRAVQIGLTFESALELSGLPAKRFVYHNGTAVTDRRWRREYRQTFALRTP